jgi:membrane protease YdiL (CAAX protease family)
MDLLIALVVVGVILWMSLLAIKAFVNMIMEWQTEIIESCFGEDIVERDGFWSSVWVLFLATVYISLLLGLVDVVIIVLTNGEGIYTLIDSQDPLETLLLLAFLEELVCRGILLAFISKISTWEKGLVWSSMIFALAHVLNFDLSNFLVLILAVGFSIVVQGLFGGTLFGLVYIKLSSNNRHYFWGLFWSTIIHTFYNFYHLHIMPAIMMEFYK